MKINQLVLSSFVCILVELSLGTGSLHLKQDEEISYRKERIREGMKHAWNGYKRYAGFEHDELRPVTKKSYDWMGMSVTLFSSLDTLWIMDFKEEFEEAEKWIVDKFEIRNDLNVSFFETTIRVIGGLLGAHSLSGHQIFLTTAGRIADRLMIGWEEKHFLLSSNSNLKKGILPFPSIDLSNGKGYSTWGQPVTTLAELGTFGLEFNYLSFHLNDSRYKEMANNVMIHMDSLNPTLGLYPLLYNLADGSPSTFYLSSLTVGASADSFYEYILKLWIQSGKTDISLRKLYEESKNGILSQLVFSSNPNQDWYLAEINGGAVVHEMDHLACFLPGTLSLGAIGEEHDADLEAAEKIMETCFNLYACSPSGLAADRVEFVKGMDFKAKNTAYLLRPEAVESLFLLYRKTKKTIYREWAWQIFKSIERNCRTEVGYSGIQNVLYVQNPPKDDIMHAYFLSETLKYLFLIMTDDSVLPFDSFVFNTEAHPFSI